VVVYQLVSLAQAWRVEDESQVHPNEFEVRYLCIPRDFRDTSIKQRGALMSAQWFDRRGHWACVLCNPVYVRLSIVLAKHPSQLLLDLLLLFNQGTEDSCTLKRIFRFDRTTLGGDCPSRAIRTPRAPPRRWARRSVCDQVDPPTVENVSMTRWRRTKSDCRIQEYGEAREYSGQPKNAQEGLYDGNGGHTWTLDHRTIKVSPE
jgi:hypothetical protein